MLLFLAMTNTLQGSNSEFKKCNANIPTAFKHTCSEVDPDFVPEGFGLE